MDRELIEQKIQEIQEGIRKLIDDAYVCGYKDGYMECTLHKGLAKSSDVYEMQKPVTTISIGGE